MKENEIAVSVIVPAYNLEKFIGNCINSILSQSLKSFELILIDDCSCDDTKKVIKEYMNSEKSADIILLENDQNMGAGYSRNRGLDIARGKYLLFLDGDDIFEHNMLEKLYTVCEEIKADIAICNFYFYYNDTRKSVEHNAPIDLFINSAESFKLTDISDCAFQYLREMAWNKMFRREFIVKNGIRFQCQNNANDQFFVYASLLKAERIVKISDYLLSYRINRENQLSTSGNISKKPLCIWNATKATLDYIDQLGLYDLYQSSFNIYAVTRLTFSLKKAEPSQRTMLLEFYKTRGFDALKLKDCHIEDFGIPYFFAMYQWLINLDSPEELEESERWALWNNRDKCEDFLRELAQEKNMVLWGAGKNGNKFLEMVSDIKPDIRYAVDMDKNKIGQTIHGYAIKHIDCIDNDNLIIAVNPDHIVAIRHYMFQHKKKAKILDVRACLCFGIAYADAKFAVL